MSDLLRFSNLAKRQNTSLFTIFSNLKNYEQLENISKESEATIKKILNDLDFYQKLSRDKSSGVLLYEYLDRTRYLKKLANSKKFDAELKVQNIAKFFDIVNNFSQVSHNDKVVNFVNYLDMLIEAGDNPATAEADIDMDAVQVMTVHKAKGLEFPVVFLVGLVQQRFPHNRQHESLVLPEELIKEKSVSKYFHLQEERRLFYVAITRAQQELYLSSARDYGGLRPKKISQFVTETLDRPVANEEYIRVSPLQQISRYAPIEMELSDAFKPIPEDQLITLSALRIDDYLTCPLKFKFVHVLRVPILPHHSVIYGRALHEAVEEYLRRKIRSIDMTLEEMIQIFENSWSSEGFISQEHEKLRFLAGKEALAQFYKRQEKESQLPLYIEKEFSFIWQQNRIIGRWDRIDQTENGIEILDYKSSAVRQQDKADKRAKESLQLAIYAIAYHDIYHKYPKRVKLYFLESGLIGGIDVQPILLDKTLEKIKCASDGIRKRNYEATPSYMSCRFCAFANICPAALV